MTKPTDDDIDAEMEELEREERASSVPTPETPKPTPTKRAAPTFYGKEPLWKRNERVNDLGQRMLDAQKRFYLVQAKGWDDGGVARKEYDTLLKEFLALDPLVDATWQSETRR